MRTITLFTLLLIGSLITQPAFAAQLIMVEEAGCVYCKKCNEEIAPAYPNTADGKLAPSRRVEKNEFNR